MLSKPRSGLRTRPDKLLLDENLVDLLDADRRQTEFMPSFSYQDLKVYSAIRNLLTEQYKPGEELEITFLLRSFRVLRSQEDLKRNILSKAEGGTPTDSLGSGQNSKEDHPATYRIQEGQEEI